MGTDAGICRVGQAFSSPAILFYPWHGYGDRFHIAAVDSDPSALAKAIFFVLASNTFHCFG
jgi:hypothetical protein